MSSSLVTDNTGVVYTFDFDTGQLRFLADFNLQFTDIDVTRGGKIFATTFTGLYELDVARGRADFVGALPNGANGLEIARNGNVLVGFGNDDSIIAYSGTGQAKFEFARLQFDTVEGDMQFFGGQFYVLAEDNTMQIFSNNGSFVQEIFHGVGGMFAMTVAGGNLYGFSGDTIYRWTGTGFDDVAAFTNPIDIWGAGVYQTLLTEGTRANDRMNGTRADDKIVAKRGNDVLDGKGGDDVLKAGPGRDILIGGSGDDRLFGGSGADTFVFARRSGDDVIRGFDARSDAEKIDLSKVRQIQDFADLSRNHMDRDGQHVVIEAGNASITLLRTNINLLDADDFIF